MKKRVDKKSNVSVPVTAPVTPVERVTKLLVDLCELRWGVAEATRVRLLERMTGIALDEEVKPDTSIAAFYGILEAQKIDIATTKVLVDAITPRVLESNGAGNGNGMNGTNGIQVSDDDLIEGTAKLLERRGTATVDPGDDRNGNVVGPALAGTVAFDD